MHTEIANECEFITANKQDIKKHKKDMKLLLNYNVGNLYFHTHQLYVFKLELLQ